MGNITLGKHSYGGIQIIGGTIGQIIIGKYCSLAENIRAFMSHDHNTHNISTFPFGHGGMAISKLMKPPLPTRRQFNTMRKLKVVVGNDVWIGSHVVLFREVTIGDGAVIGAYATITKDVPPYAVVVGNNRIIRKRFSDPDIEFLLKLKWWDFPDQVVADIAHILCSPDINALKTWAAQNGKI